MGKARMSKCSLHTKLTLDVIKSVPERDLAAHWKKSVRTLQRWRRDGYGPAYFTIGSTIFYRLDDILAFEETQRTVGVSQ